jgi:hypothetical protein
MRIREIIFTLGVIVGGIAILDFRFWIFDSCVRDLGNSSHPFDGYHQGTKTPRKKRKEKLTTF